MTLKSSLSLVVLVCLSLLLLSFFVGVVGAADDWVIDGSKVYIDDSRVYLSADPHTISSQGWVTFTLESKLYTGDIDVVWGFSQPDVKPKKAEIYKPYYNNWTTEHSQTFYYVTSFTPVENGCEYGYDYNTFHYSVDYSTPEYDELGNTTDWQPTTTIICFDSYEWLDSNNCTVTWHQQHSEYIEWVDINGDSFEIIQKEHGGMNTWYLLKDVPVTTGQTYVLRAWVDIPLSLQQTVGKYWWGLKPSSLSISEAIEQDKFYALDPWYSDPGYQYRKVVHLTGSEGAGTNYQVQLEIASDTGIGTPDFHLEGNCENFCQDIRFSASDGSTPLDYWIEDTTSDPIVVWVKVADDLGSNTDIYCYYGKSGDSTTSDGDDTFLFFDDFEDLDLGDLDGQGGWTVVSGTYTVQNTTVYQGTKAVQASGDSGTFEAYNTFQQSKNVAIDIAIRRGSEGACFNLPSLYEDATIIANLYNILGWSRDNTFYSWYTGAVNYVDDASAADTWYEWRMGLLDTDDCDFHKRIAGTWTFQEKQSADAGHSMTDGVNRVYISFGAGTGATKKGYYDIIKIHKYASTEPAFSSAGDEEAPLLPPENFSHIMNGCDFWVNITWDANNSNVYTDGFNVSWDNGTDNGWMNGTADYINLTVPPQGTVNITVYSWNATYGYSEPVNYNVTIPICIMLFTNCPSCLPVDGCGCIYYDFNVTDTGDPLPFFSVNPDVGTLNNSTGVFTWCQNLSDWLNTTENLSFGVQIPNYTNITYCNVTIGCFDSFIYLQNLELVEEQEMLADMWLYLILALISIVLLFTSFFVRRGEYYVHIIMSIFSMVLAFLLALYSPTEEIAHPELAYIFVFLGMIALIASTIFVSEVIQDIWPITEKAKARAEDKARREAEEKWGELDW